MSTNIPIPEADDAISFLTGLLHHLEEAFDVEVGGYAVDPDGSVSMDLRVHVPPDAVE
jgi:hypothetical protein